MVSSCIEYVKNRRLSLLFHHFPPDKNQKCKIYLQKNSEFCSKKEVSGDSDEELRKDPHREACGEVLIPDQDGEKNAQKGGVKQRKERADRDSGRDDDEAPQCLQNLGKEEMKSTNKKKESVGKEKWAHKSKIYTHLLANGKKFEGKGGWEDDEDDIIEEDKSMDSKDNELSKNEESVWCCGGWLDPEDTEEHQQTCHTKPLRCTICNKLIEETAGNLKHFQEILGP